MQSALRKLENSRNEDRQKFLDIVMDECCSLTGSKISYFASMNESEDILTMQVWSVSARSDCSMMMKPIVYLLEDTGLWGDAVRDRKAVITNNYKTLRKPTKKGYPAGHVEIIRHMNAPVFEGSRIVGITGVGNKPANYTDADAEILTAFMNEAWKILKTKLQTI